MAKAAWECADPGIQYDDTINDWHTTPESGRINASNPCCEYMHLDNSSCNLASLNLMTFLTPDGTFDAEQFATGGRAGHHRDGHLDLLRRLPDRGDRGDHPRLPPARDRLRQPRRAADGVRPGYDSDGGRALAASITSLMTGTAYNRSAELAGVVGPYDGYARNADAHRRVMRKHAAANDAVRTMHPIDRDVHPSPPGCGARGWRSGRRTGWRNAQASRAGPDRDHRLHDGLRHHRHRAGLLAGEVQEARRRRVDADRQPDDPARRCAKLGYAEETVEAIVEYIAEHGHVVDAPGLQAGALRGLRLRDGRAGDQADGPRPDDGGVPAVPVRRDLQDGEPAGDGDGRGDRGRLLPGLEARPEGARGVPRQLQGRPAAVGRQGQEAGCGRAGRREGRRVPPDPQAAAEDAGRAQTTSFARRRRRGLHDRRLLPGRRPRRGVPQARQAGLDAGRGDGRLLDRDLHRAAVRRAAGDVRARSSPTCGSSRPA